MERHDPSSRNEAPSIGRRRFVRWLGIGGLAGAFAGVLGAIAAGEARAQATTPPVAPTPPPVPADAAVPSDEAKALHGVLTGRYGAHLDAAQSASLLGALDQTVRSGKALRAHALANSVEPDTVFRAVPPQRVADGDAGGRR